MSKKTSVRTSAPSPTTVDVVVPSDVRAFFTDVTITGQGGFQSLCRGLADRLQDRAVLHLSPEEFRRIVRYATDYGDGGFQQRLRKIVVGWVNQHLDQLVTLN